MERARQGVFALCLLLSFSTRGSSQTVAEMANLQGALPVEMSPDGSTLWYRIGQGSRLLDGVWEISVSAGGAPRLSNHSVPKAQPALVIPGSPEASNVRRSPDGKEIAYLKERSLYCSCKRSPDGKPSAVSGKSILAFEWADTSKAFWVIAGDGPDEPVGLLKVDGHFEQVTKTPALRRRGGFVAAGGSVAWVESDGSHYGSIWTRDRQGRVRMRVDLNPQLANWTLGKQEVIRWKNSFGEELHGILVRPGGKRSPLIVDPYSSGRNGFLNTTLLGNYIFVKEGFAIFLPNHRAPHTLPAAMFGSDYVGSAKNRDPVDVLVDDVMLSLI